MKNRKNRGITLIALIITIIVLLILAGITINLSIGQDGILNRAREAGIEYEKAQIKEELELAILDIKADKLSKGQSMKREDLKGLEKIGAIMESTGTPAKGEYKDYFFEVDEDYIVTMGEKVTGIKPEMSLTKNTDEIVEEVIITVKASILEGTIVSITKPDGTITTETEFEYKVTENKMYRFIAEGSNGRRTISNIQITNIKETATEPIIVSNFGYPVLKTTGVELDGTTTITYDTKEGLENYYSLDNGTTWNKYTGPFEIEESLTIMAKSVKNGIILSETSKTLSMPQDGAPEILYDEKTDTGIEYYGNTKMYYINVSSEMQGRTIAILMSMGSYTTYGIKCYNNDKEISSQLKSGGVTNSEIEYTIIEGTNKIGLYWSSSHAADWGRMFELTVKN